MIRMAVARNVMTLRDRVYSKERSETARNRKLAEAIGSKLSQVQRICEGKVGTSIDTIEWLADALGVEPRDLLTPYFANHASGASESDGHNKKPDDQTSLQRRHG